MTSASTTRVGLLVGPRLLHDGLARVLTSRDLQVVDIATGDERVEVLIVSEPRPDAPAARVVIALPADGGAAAIVTADGTVLRRVTGLEGILQAVEDAVGTQVP